MKYIKYKLSAYIACLALIFASCESTELDLTTDPNNLSVEQSDPNFLLNGVLLNFTSVWNGFNGPSRDLTRMENLFSTYGSIVNTLTLDGATGEYATSYRTFGNIQLLEDLNNDGADIPVHVGIAKTIQAYNLFLLVDYLGDVPFSEANNAAIEQPVADPGAEVYQAALDILDEAIVLLNTSTINLPTSDFYYDANTNNWISLANTLKIRAYTNLALSSPAESASAINSILSQGNIIDMVDEDFNFSYTQTGPPVESRHPFFTGNYLPGGASTYMSNYYMFLLKDAKAVEDPRLTYYVYRQTGRAPEGQEIPCEGNAVYDYCYIGDGYWGRDHADNEGLPADNILRTTYGIYPGGGAYDDEQFVSTVNSSNAGGAGIQPIFNSSFTHFLLAEGALKYGVNGDPLNYLNIAITQSFDKVSGFLGSPEIDAAAVNAYLDAVNLEYANAAGDEDQQLFIIEREFLLAMFGNGVEAYNMYRRTGMPIDPSNPGSLSSIQSPVFPAGPFPRVFVYGQNVVNNNQNITQNETTERVFWDTNPVGFID
ncbi:SusD/RagB family nutrient-binding outer membrane lipoprotein [Dokdonia sp. Hel_I_53]|uniref:SusD/RagB family nutrient-binding outer membrane lipoprotein n=1 Tax=Dokdonia sp. Hel_I_53 TaxID=1566287 RepID=UPI001199FAB9|nr:SusD/RagB family nutrient-binding outer membrane lipoprotein [Dokdonia sp. Hel_I_53]TVZ52058.1 SusD-like starch-binding protein associating with outer membrane [Dokdonia sp. Hel_I_53]